MNWALFIVVPVDGKEVIIRAFYKTRSELDKSIRLARAYISKDQLRKMEAWNWQDRVLLHSA